jgi:hypothetical protein
MMEMLSQLSLKSSFFWALTIHNDDLIDTGWMPDWIAINTRFLASKTVVRKQSFVTPGKQILINFCFRGYYLVYWLQSRATKLNNLLHRTSLSFLDTRGFRTASKYSCQSFGIMLIWKLVDISLTSAIPRRSH